MNFNAGLLESYKNLVQTTSLADSYREFVRLFRFLRAQLEKEMPDYQFQGNIVENAMDYSYFQFSDQALKSRGLKIVVVFIHKQFRFEIWLSGVNRSNQKRFHDLLAGQYGPFLPAENPERMDFILRAPLPENWDMTDGDAMVSALKEKSLALIDWAERKME
ncbi:MAG TPA: hypothetical protein IAC30_08250 [Candidatus Faecousia intestinavium]|nr:hypothetical protein [Candidatus Faecousia intestinavium]